MSCSAVKFPRAATVTSWTSQPSNTVRSWPPCSKMAWSFRRHPHTCLENEFSSSGTDEPGSRNIGSLVATFLCLSLTVKGRTAEYETRPLRAWVPPQVMPFWLWKIRKSDRLYPLLERNRAGNTGRGRGRGMAYRIVIIASNRSMTAAASRCGFICASA